MEAEVFRVASSEVFLPFTTFAKSFTRDRFAIALRLKLFHLFLSFQLMVFNECGKMVHVWQEFLVKSTRKLFSASPTLNKMNNIIPLHGLPFLSIHLEKENLLVDDTQIH